MIAQSAMFADGNELVRSMGHRQQSWSVGERGNAVSRVEPRFEQSGAHLERRLLSGHGGDVARQNQAERVLCGVAAAGSS